MNEGSLEFLEACRLIRIHVINDKKPYHNLRHFRAVSREPLMKSGERLVIKIEICLIKY